jgi:hypothetical protein
MQCAAGGSGDETRSAPIPASVSPWAAGPGRPQPGPVLSEGRSPYPPSEVSS